MRFSLFALTAVLAAQTSLPSFDRYPAAGPKFSGKPAPPVLKTAYERNFRTAIRDAAARGPNFAGHYTIAEWGCGAGCVSIVVVDAVNGAIHDGPFRNLSPSSDDPNIQPLEYRLPSRLLIARGCPEETACASYFWEWTGSAFSLVRKVPSTPLAAEDFYLGSWKIVEARVAPWADNERKPDTAERNSLVGAAVTMEAQAIRGPRALACTKLRYEVKEYPADMLFQGAFGEMHAKDKSADPVKIAEKIGFRGSQWKTLETGCGNEIDYHFLDPATAAFGLNNYVYFLKKQ
jgi:hypothetical protein